MHRTARPPHESVCAPDGAKAQDGPEPTASLEPCLAPPLAPVSLDPVLSQLFRALYWLEGQPGIEWDVAWRRPAAVLGMIPSA